MKLSPSDLAWDKFPQAEAILVFSRSLGAAHTGTVQEARKDVERLHTLKDKMTTAKMGYWAGQTDFQIKAVEAWIALAEKRNDDAVRLMRAAAESEEASDKHPSRQATSCPAGSCSVKC